MYPEMILLLIFPFTLPTSAAPIDLNETSSSNITIIRNARSGDLSKADINNYGVGPFLRFFEDPNPYATARPKILPPDFHPEDCIYPCEEKERPPADEWILVLIGALFIILAVLCCVGVFLTFR